MASCTNCGATIIMGGVREGGDRFCNGTCRDEHVMSSVSVPDDVLKREIQRVFDGMCPVCQGSGPVDLHTSYRVWSALLLTSWRGHPRLSCARCAQRAKVGSTLFSLALGWWGFPYGLFMTPVMVFRNVAGLVMGASSSRPSDGLRRALRSELAKVVVAQQNAMAAQAAVHAAELVPGPLPTDPKQLN